jgi:tripartite-type tricarboxylate transporter receptor subunit TctC
MRKVIAAACAAAFVAVGSAMAAEDYPSRSITILVPFAPGGIVDIAARTVGEHLSQRWGQEVIVENRTGGAGFIAATAAARAEPDGYTLLMAESGVSAINPSLFDDVPYDMERDFIPITTVSDTPLVLVARADAPFETVQEFVEYAQENPDELSFASAGIGTLNHIAPEWIAMEAGIELRPIHYRGGAPAATAIAGGEADVGVLALSSVEPFVQSGDLKVLAVARARPAETHPDIPTIQEEGIPNVDTSQWAGLFAPSGVPEEIVDKLHGEIVDILESEEVQAQFAERGAEAIPMEREDFADMVRRLSEQYRVIVETAEITPE